ncbi:MAG: PaaI family thioesterase [Deltaproteobacteria bacterium]|nr:PaaI family thioesterase [Deltaproteobacteria bacterium]
MTFDRFVGMEFEEEGGELVARLAVQAHHCNPTGNVNGGVILSLADNLATGVANRAYLAKTGEQRFLVAVDLHAVMLANQQGGALRAVARPVRVGRRVTVIRTEVRGEGDRVLAEVTSTHVPT